MCLEVHRRRQNPDTGVWENRILFFNVVVFGSLGETAAKYVREGRQIGVDGWLDLRAWENSAGACVEAVSVVAESVQFIGALPEDVAEEGRGALVAA
jgi:single-stranded DNA-binding protein